jgi:Tol biopolymer transport system component
MTLSPGTRIGPYEVIAPLGAGGMGEVYRARDAKLGRDVALKIMASSFASDPDRLARFEREARTLAALNHPNIAHIYGLEESGSGGTPVTALVMELVEGEDLARRIARGAVPLEDARPIARQIADGLDAAHELGIIHRDLKPANIKLRADGTIKILDFGLAKGVGEPDVPVSDVAWTNSPTVAPPAMTSPGVLLGTAAYMSPEQARGASVDRRADIWAFGCVLYELLTGRPVFDAGSVAEILSAIFSREPDWSALPAATPPSIQRLLRRCLVRDPRKRLRSLGDALFELDPESERERPEAAVQRRRPSLVERAGWLAAGLAIGAGALFWVMTRSAPAPAAPASIVLERVTDAIGHEESPAVSPDGKTIAWVERVRGRQQIWVRLLAGGAGLQLTRADADHTQPRWTPDSSALIYFTPGASARDFGTLWEIPALGGAARPLMQASSGGDVSHDGRRVTAFRIQEDRTVLIVARRDGASVERTINLPVGHLDAYPRWSPDDQWIAFQSSDAINFDTYLSIVSATSGESRPLARGDYLYGLAWLADGTGIVFSSAQGSTVLYPPTFNLRVVYLDGTPERQVTFGDVSYVEPDAHGASLAASRIKSQSDVWRIPIESTPERNVREAIRVTHQTGVAQVPSVNPDESEVVYLSDSGGHGNLWVASLKEAGAARQITFERDPNVSVGVPVWSPANRTIAVVRTSAGSGGLWLLQADGSGLRRLVDGFWGYWSPDGQWLYYGVERDGSYQIEKVAADGGTPTTVRRDPVIAPAASPDGTLYFVAPPRGGSRMGEWVLQKARPESAEARTLTSINGARVPTDPNNIHPILSPDARWLAQPLIDSGTTNLWLIDTRDGTMKPATAFDRPVVIARRVSWSRDSRHIYAAVAETDADVVLLRDVLRR